MAFVLVFTNAGGGEGFAARTDGPAYAAATKALEAAFGAPVSHYGMGGSIRWSRRSTRPSPTPR